MPSRTMDKNGAVIIVNSPKKRSPGDGWGCHRGGMKEVENGVVWHSPDCIETKNAHGLQKGHFTAKFNSANHT